MHFRTILCIFAKDMSIMIETTLKNLSDFPSSQETPFITLDDIEYRTYYTKETTREVTDRNTGEISLLSDLPTRKTGFKDSAKYTKLFHGGKLKLSELTSSGTKVLCYIMINARPNQEEICLHPKLVAEDMGYKNQRSVYEGLVDLLNLGLLACKTGYGSCFWINPNLFFNGDRRLLLNNPVREAFRTQLIEDNIERLKNKLDSKTD